MAVTEISIVLWFIFFGFSVFFGLLMVRKAMSPDFERPQREYYVGLAIFIIVHLVARIFYYFHDFIHVGDLFFWEIGALIGIAGVIFLIYAIERNIYTRSKFIITIIVIINLILLIVLPPELKDIARIFNTALVGIFIPLIYVYVAYKSTGIYRRNSLLNAIGILIFLGGQAARSQPLFTTDNIIFFIVSPILMLVGGTLFLYGLIKTA